MNQDTTSLIEQKANEYANTGSFQEWLKLQPFGLESSFSKTKRNFKAGISLALQTPELYRGLLVEAMEWIQKNFEPSIRRGIWYQFKKGSSEIIAEITTEELVTIFIQHKQESNGTK